MVYSHTKCLYYIHLNQKLNLQKHQPQGQLTSYLIYKIMRAQKLLFAFLLLSSWSTFCSSESFSDFLIDLSALYQFILYIIYIYNYFRGNFSFFFFSSNPVINYCLLTKVKAQCTFLGLPCLYLFYFCTVLSSQKTGFKLCPFGCYLFSYLTSHSNFIFAYFGAGSCFLRNTPYLEACALCLNKCAPPDAFAS